MKKRFGKASGGASVVNAIQHCTWICYVKNLWWCSKNDAVALGEAHERGHDNGFSNNCMDAYNNAIGSMIKANGVGECANKCIQKAKNGKLYWMDSIDEGKWEKFPSALAGLSMPEFAPICTGGGFSWVDISSLPGPPVLNK